MRKLITIFIGFLIITGCLKEKTNMQNNEQVKPLAFLPIGNNDSVKGISAPFAGYMDNHIFVAGGCNFPAAPASKGGVKEYYKSVYRYDAGKNAWTHVGELPAGLAYGASVVYGSEWICLGGNNNESSSSSVWAVRYNGQLMVDTLPSLPASMDNFAATLSGHKIYVAGGNVDGRVQNKMYMLDLKERKQWEELTSFPGAGRVQPVLLSGIGGSVILLGGFQAGNMEEAPVLSPDVYAYNPESGVWTIETQLPLSTADSAPLAMVGGFGVNISDSLFVIGGGVNRTRFIHALDAGRRIDQAIKNKNQSLADSLSAEKAAYMTHPVEWYQFNSDLYIYNMITKQWSLSGSYPAVARAGAGAVTDGHALYVIDGELKPGVRTDEVNRISLD